jgi:hypothetical protein
MDRTVYVYTNLPSSLRHFFLAVQATTRACSFRRWPEHHSCQQDAGFLCIEATMLGRTINEGPCTEFVGGVTQRWGESLERRTLDKGRENPLERWDYMCWFLVLSFQLLAIVGSFPPHRSLPFYGIDGSGIQSPADIFVPLSPDWLWVQRTTVVLPARVKRPERDTCTHVWCWSWEWLKFCLFLPHMLQLHGAETFSLRQIRTRVNWFLYGELILSGSKISFQSYDSHTHLRCLIRLHLT